MVNGYKSKNKIEKKNKSNSLRQRTTIFLQEINGFSPYEKNILNFLKIGKEKKALKFAKKHLGNIKRAKTKIEILNNLTRII